MKKQQWLDEAHANDIKLSGIIYLQRIIDVKTMETAGKNLTMFKKLCGTDSSDRICLSTTTWRM